MAPLMRVILAAAAVSEPRASRFRLGRMIAAHDKKATCGRLEGREGESNIESFAREGCAIAKQVASSCLHAHPG